MTKPHNPHPKFTKPYLSWKRRAESMKDYLECTGHSVTYTDAGAFVMFNGRCVSKPKRWWQVWKWW